MESLADYWISREFNGFMKATKRLYYILVRVPFPGLAHEPALVIWDTPGNNSDTFKRATGVITKKVDVLAIVSNLRLLSTDDLVQYLLGLDKLSELGRFIQLLVIQNYQEPPPVDPLKQRCCEKTRYTLISFSSFILSKPAFSVDSPFSSSLSYFPPFPYPLDSLQPSFDGLLI
jgi:hypothetical protein